GMDRFERIQRQRDEYEAAQDEAERLRDDYHREIVKLHRSGMSLREIAEGLGISHQRVHQIVTPFEETSGSRSNKRRATGAAGVVVILLIAGAVWLPRSEIPTTDRSAPIATPAPHPRPRVIPCRVHPAERSSFSAITASAQCAQQAVVVMDPRTGRVLALVSEQKLITTIDQPLQQRLEDLLQG
nr:hypothetical protein [Actinomycetota bacterium]